jgi:hypothetical protein
VFSLTEPTKRKRAEEALRQSEASLAKAAELVKVAYTIGGTLRRTPAIHARIGA